MFEDLVLGVEGVEEGDNGADRVVKVHKIWNLNGEGFGVGE